MDTPWNSRLARTPKADPITPSVRLLCRMRDKGSCVLCGADTTHLHHRQLRRHGVHTARNLISLCAFCHNRVHGHVAWSREFGLIVASTVDPGDIPVSTATGRFYLDDNGTATPAQETA